jgi:hypothetical protein
MAELATKTDLAALRDHLLTEIGHVDSGLRKEIDHQTLKLTVRLGLLMAAGIAVLGAIVKLT